VRDVDVGRDAHRTVPLDRDHRNATATLDIFLNEVAVIAFAGQRERYGQPGLVTVLRRSPESLKLVQGDRRDDQAY
jgi:hypothetical protein